MQNVFRTISTGVEMKILRKHNDQGMTFLIRMEKGAHALRHDHPGGEETFLLEGRLRITNRIALEGHELPDATLGVGEYFFSPPGEQHDGVAEEAALFLVIAPGGVSRTTPK
jgi:quercetin dioxygenase-like cupin family protein